MSALPDRADYVIIGAGSAGCVLANRLSADPKNRVVVLEAGGQNAHLLATMPAGMATLMRGPNQSNWAFESEPVEALGGRRMFVPRGKGWGGSSSINGMLYVRGNRADYDQWRQMGLAGWSYDDVLPLFRRMENFGGEANEWHGTEGELPVRYGEIRDPIYHAFIAAGRAAGHRETEDFNGAEQEGVGRYQVNIEGGRRAGARRAFLLPALKRPNLVAATDIHVTRIVVEEGRAVAVEYVTGKDRTPGRIAADREIIVSAGTMQSPQILGLSGIGDPEDLRALGLPVVASLPGVGRNLQDHVDIAVTYRSRLPLLWSRTKGWRAARIGIQYLLSRGGLGASNSLEAGGFLKTRPELDRPDVQIQFIPGAMVNHGQKGMQPFDGFSIDMIALHPESRGTVRLRSADPFAAPEIHPNHLATPGDVATLRAAVWLAREIGEQPALAPWRIAEDEPGKDVIDDDAIDAWLRERAATIFHPVGTCRMGAADDPGAVTDAALRVRGVAGLRVADASVMPTIVTGNTNAASMMIGEKAADLVLGRA
ncbi:GMC family oxidoreductase [Sphingomonas jatrophae]|uniref:Choline dehydrogenase n=1 Tax=Sphingomonas jatrophae TaxID=1166337 RepID=A0A1I6KJT4_9SPHN|nr:choline dehydrogenase [Sphingomonas jatrophae]SFR91466.1 choline dehydrogenase [Sphingomonas jatrophae]